MSVSVCVCLCPCLCLCLCLRVFSLSFFLAPRSLCVVCDAPAWRYGLAILSEYVRSLVNKNVLKSCTTLLSQKTQNHKNIRFQPKYAVYWWILSRNAWFCDSARLLFSHINHTKLENRDFWSKIAKYIHFMPYNGRFWVFSHLSFPHTNHIKLENRQIRSIFARICTIHTRNTGF